MIVNSIKKTILGLTSLSAVSLGADVALFDERVIDDQVVQVSEELVDVKQIENTVEATFPWKDQTGIKVKYDMGVPTLEEQVKDQRKAEVITETVQEFDGGFKIDVLLNERPDTNQFCYTIEGAENYDFFFQPPLTPEEIAEGMERPPEIEGSYAVYHKTLKNHRMGNENYATGKLMHIPRPQVWSLADEATKVWADMQYDNGNLCVTVPQDFLDKAEYPVRVDPTFGYTTIGATQVIFSAASAHRGSYYNPLTAGDGDVITGLSVYGRCGIATSSSIAIGVYDIVGGVVTNLVNTGPNGQTITISSSTALWYASSSLSISLTAGTQYGLAVGAFNSVLGSCGASIRLYSDTGASGIESYSTMTGANTLQTTWVEGSTNNQVRSMYATLSCGTGEGFHVCPFATGTSLWTAPTGVTEVAAACWGGGGSGADGPSTNGGGGGGGGAFASSTVAVTPGQQYPVVVGAGGAAQGASINTGVGASGATSTFATTSVIAAPGWGGVITGGNGGAAASSTGDVTRSGGQGGQPHTTNDLGGGGGGGAGPHNNGGHGANAVSATVAGGGGGGNNALNAVGGNGASSTATGGGGGRGFLTIAGEMGTTSSYGGGGGGGGSNNFGGGAGATVGGGGGGGDTGAGAGGNGQCLLAYTVPAAGGSTPESPKDDFLMIFSQKQEISPLVIHNLIAPPRRFFSVNDRLI